jgi:hypothetical protein
MCPWLVEEHARGHRGALLWRGDCEVAWLGAHRVISIASVDFALGVHRLVVVWHERLTDDPTRLEVCVMNPWPFLPFLRRDLWRRLRPRSKILRLRQKNWWREVGTVNRPLLPRRRCEIPRCQCNPTIAIRSPLLWNMIARVANCQRWSIAEHTESICPILCLLHNLLSFLLLLDRVHFIRRLSLRLKLSKQLGLAMWAIKVILHQLLVSLQPIVLNGIYMLV